MQDVHISVTTKKKLPICTISYDYESHTFFHEFAV
jgi:hypothetical protein